MRSHLLALGLTVVASVAHGAEFASIKDGKHSSTTTLAADKGFEVCGSISSGERYQWKFDATGIVDFNIHYHVKKRVETPVSMQRVRVASAVFEPTSKHEYCWMWENKSGAPVTITAEIALLR
jgi:hypothetical protein